MVSRLVGRINSNLESWPKISLKTASDHCRVSCADVNSEWSLRKVMGRYEWLVVRWAVRLAATEVGLVREMVDHLTL